MLLLSPRLAGVTQTKEKVEVVGGGWQVARAMFARGDRRLEIVVKTQEI